MKKIGLYLLVWGMFFATAEVFWGYFIYQRDTNQFGSSAIVREIKQIYKKKMARSEQLIGTQKIFIENRTENPFLSGKLKKIPGYKFHPFIDYTNAHGIEGEFYNVDYFGFRNKEDLYFSKGKYKFVVITGGSEIMGYSHRRTVAEFLEGILNKKTGHSYKVLNLGMNSYVVENEISAYIHLVYHLEPEFVISHTGWNDILYAHMVPENFKKLGLNYLRNIEEWLAGIYRIEPASQDIGSKFFFDKKGSEFIKQTFFERLDKYQKLVQSNNGTLLVGIQAINKQLMPKTIIYEAAGDVFENQILPEAEKKGYLVFQKDIDMKSFIDNVHTGHSVALKIAEIYANQIFKIVSRTTYTGDKTQMQKTIVR